MKRLFDIPVGKAITLGGGVTFALFFIGAVVASAQGSEDGAYLVGGVLAYAFLAYVVVILGVAWFRRPRGAQRMVDALVRSHPELADHLGAPMQARVPADALRGDGHANLRVPVSGPRGEGVLEISAARLGREWEVLNAALVTDELRVSLAQRTR